MGELNQHDLSQFNCNVFVETGTGKAVGTSYAVQFPQFKQLHTIEVVPLLYEYAKSTVKDPRLTFHLGNSVDKLKEIVSILNSADRVLFWLDAHFPGADYQLAPYKFGSEDMPLSVELQTIVSGRDISKDSFIIDDLNLYEDGPFQLGDSRIPRPKTGVGFVEALLSNTHSMKKDYRHQGFLVITPKG